LNRPLFDRRVGIAALGLLDHRFRMKGIEALGLVTARSGRLRERGGGKQQGSSGRSEQ